MSKPRATDKLTKRRTGGAGLAREHPPSRLEKLAEALTAVGTAPPENISRLTAACGELLDATCALYHRLSDGLLHSVGAWNVPAEYEPASDPEGQLSADVLHRGHEGGLFLVKKLPQTSYHQSDPNVARCGFRTCAGYPVSFAGQTLGSVSVLYRNDVDFGEEESFILRSIARAIGNEEERGRAEQVLRESELRFRTLAETTTLGILIAQGDRYTYVSPSAERITGYSSAELLSMNFWEPIHPEFRDLVRDRARARAAGAPDLPGRYEIKLVTKGGSRKWLDVTSGVISQGGAPALVVTLADVTEAHRLRELRATLYEISEAAQATASLDELYRSIHTAIGRLMDARNFYISLHDPARDLLTFPYFVDEVDAAPAPFPPGRGMTGYVLRSGKPLLATPEKLRELEAAGEIQPLGAPSIDWLGVPLRVDEETIGVLAVQSYSGSVRYGDTEKEILTYVSRQVAQAIARKRAEQALRASEERYRLALQATQEVTYDWDITAQTIFWNPNLEKVLGFTAAEMGTTPTEWARHLHEEDRQPVGEQFAAALRDGDAFSSEYRFRLKNGDYASVLNRALVMRDADGQPIRLVGAVTDLTARKHLEEQLRQALKMEAVGKLAGGIAHDFNNLLTALLGSTELLQRRFAPDHEAQKELATIQRTATRASELTRSLLAFARRQVLQPVNLDLNELVRETLPILRRVIPENVRVDFHPSPELGVVRVDRGQMSQILLNLCVNARDAMPSGGVLTIRTDNVEVGPEQTTVRAGAPPGRYVRLAISDTGRGMDARTLGHVFEPFFTTKDTGQGTGLGLSTVYGIVKQHNGAVSAASEPGMGATFEVLLPLVAGTSKPVQAAARSSAAGGHETVLIVEDEVEVRGVMMEVLSGLGYRVLDASDGAVALGVLQREEGRVDLVITDVVMPHMGGLALFDAAHQRWPELRFLFSSGYAEGTDHLDLVKRHGGRFLAKPYGIDTLVRTVREVLDNSPE